ncbi:response regulator [uncultured Desulfosarcina sp.]|uniref:response regulator n=1 Tax=uncultured Desulfosarcina sp. TaxID=218289 RepID=UPI0029C8FDD8|nr:response regulator [uncultured Desulfosarcina sp.]
MKVAVTVWKERISPVFDASRRLLIAEIEDRRITDRSYVIFDPEMPSNLAKILSELDVPVLICGAVSQVPANIMANGGIELIPFITGEVDRILEVYARGNPLAPAFLMPGCHDGDRCAEPHSHEQRSNPLTQLLFVTNQKNRFAAMQAEIEARDGSVAWATSGLDALERLKQTPADLVVVDENLDDMPGLTFVERLVAVNPMINCALVSSLSGKEYHDASEGLGILMQLPIEPDRGDAKQLMAHLNQILKR